MLRLTATSVSTLRKCPRQYQYRYEFGLSRISERGELTFGKAYHAGLAQFALGTDRDAAIDLATAGLTDPMMAATVRTLLAGYHWRYSEARLHPVAVEQAFEVPLINPDTGAASRTFVLAGKMDLRTPDEIVEYKTGGEDISDGSMYWLRLRLDPQLSLYWLAARAMGCEPRVVVYDVTRKPTISPKKLTMADSAKFLDTAEYMGQRFDVLVSGGRIEVNGVAAEVEPGVKSGTFAVRETIDMWAARLLQDISERPNFYYARREVPRLDDELAEFQAELWAESQTLLHRRARGLWPRTGCNTRACDYCQFADLCLQRISVDPQNPPAGYEILPDVHPELAEPPVPEAVVDGVMKDIQLAS